jgi:hypothetical protein
MPVGGNAEAEGRGALILRWLPSADLRFKAELSPAEWNAPSGVPVNALIAGEIVETLVNSVRPSARAAAAFPTQWESVCKPCGV